MTSKRIYIVVGIIARGYKRKETKSKILYLEQFENNLYSDVMNESFATPMFCLSKPDGNNADAINLCESSQRFTMSLTELLQAGQTNRKQL